MKDKSAGLVRGRAREPKLDWQKAAAVRAGASSEFLFDRIECRRHKRPRLCVMVTVGIENKNGANARTKQALGKYQIVNRLVRQALTDMKDM